jgi:multidrug efflux system outer membrane protein
VTGSFGYQNPQSDALLSVGSSFWRVGPAIRWNILNLRRILSGIEASEAVREGSLARYERTILNALEEVENALVGLAGEKDGMAALVAAVEANRLAADLALERYKGGLESYLAVIDAQGALRASQDQLAQRRGNMALAMVALYKALGGGWRVPGPEEPATE